jgi:cytochrome P450
MAAFEFDHWSAQLAADPHPVYRELRARCPVAHTDAHDGYWIVTGYDEVREAAGLPDVFSSALVSIPENIGLSGVPLPPLDLVPPRHAKFRRMLLPFFSPARAEAMRPVTVAIANELIDTFIDRGDVDVATEYARQVPTAVLARILGVSPDDEAQFGKWIHAIVETAATDMEGAVVAGGELLGYFMQLIGARRDQPQDDLISFLLQATVDGEPVSEPDQLGCCILLLIAGIDTTWSTLGSSLLYLADHPEAREVFRTTTPATTRALEELLRFFAPTSVTRGLTCDAELGGVQLSAGDRALLVFPSANRDEGKFDHADEVRLNREPNRHQTFGYGAHVCLGAPLARMEMHVGLQEFLRRIPDFKVRDHAEITWKPGPIHGPSCAPLIF